MINSGMGVVNRMNVIWSIKLNFVQKKKRWMKSNKMTIHVFRIEIAHILNQARRTHSSS